MSDNQIEEVKQKNDIVDIVGERVTLKKTGRNMRGLCPFHGEKSPSFFVSPESQTFKCFGCGVGGDVITFWQTYEGVTFREALQALANRVGITLEKMSVNKDDDKRTQLLEILHWAGEYYHYLLMTHEVGKEPLKYLKNRGILKQTMRDFKIGYALESWDGLVTFLNKKKKYSYELIEEAGMAIEGQRGGYYDRFRGRIMFPLKDYSGKIVGFSGRLMEANPKEAKYINTPETMIYHKSELLFGLSNVKQYIRQKDRVVVTEGEMDMLQSYQVGLKEVVAIKGSAMTNEHALLLRRLTHNVILALDADEAGQKAIQRAIPIAEKQGLSLRVVKIEGGKDPDELAKTNPDVWKKMVQDSVSVYRYYIDTAFAKFDANSGIGQKEISNFLTPILSQIENSVEQAFYIKDMANRLGVQERAVLEEIEKLKKKEKIGDEVVTPKKTEARSRQEMMERYAVGLVLQTSEKLGEVMEGLEVGWFSEVYLQKLVSFLKDYRGGVKEMFEKMPTEMRGMAEELYMVDLGILENSMEEIKDQLKEIRRQLEEAYLKRRMIELAKIMGKEEDGDSMAKVQDEYAMVAKRLKEL